MYLPYIMAPEREFTFAKNQLNSFGRLRRTDARTTHSVRYTVTSVV